MGDARAGTSGTTATTDPTPSPPPATPGRAMGKRVARHAAEQPTSQPYTGRRIAQLVPPPVDVVPAPVRVARCAERSVPVGRRIAFIPELQSDVEDVAGHLLRPTATPVLETYAGRRIAQPVQLITEPAVVKPVATTQPGEPVVEQPIVPDPVVVEAAELVDPVLAAHPELRVDVPSAPPRTRVISAPGRPGGRRIASRRSRLPSLPLLAGVAVLAVSAGGALQAVQPGLSPAAADGHLSPASALSGSSGVGSASLLGGRGTVVSRGSDRRSASSAGGQSLQAAADQQAEQRDAALSAFAAEAEKQASKIELHQWVLPVTPGVYHLTARFGDSSSLWSHFHTGLDFAGPTGTPIVAVAGGTIAEVGYTGAYGNRTIETLADGTELWYCHQNSFDTSAGATVKPGQLIGYIGSTGNVTGPHLHLEVHPGGGDPVDPYTALVVHGLKP
jgi:murein DD-endopeptidase MepM/ murein hydrolase activator NlpD